MNLYNSLCIETEGDTKMNEKDKKAFDKWWISNKYQLSPFYWHDTSLVGSEILATWQAACEYKQKEVDFFKDRNETNISKATCINQVNDGLHILLKEAEAELFEWKEAARSEADEVNRLQAENRKLREALEFYANCTRLILDVKDLPIDPIIGAPIVSSMSIMDNGDRARKTLKEIIGPK
jgi:hypothetical protein